jgi:flagellin
MTSIYYASGATNLSASTAANYMNRFQDAVNQSVERISSGKKLNSASDDPSQIGYAGRMRAAIMSYRKLNDNMQDTISMLQTADYAVSGTGGMESVLHTIREKAVQSENVTLSSQDRLNLQLEIEDLIEELDDIAKTTEFNTKKLLNGEMGAKLSSTSADLGGFATDVVSSGSYYFTDIEGATKHVFDADNAPTPTADTAIADYDYSSTLGISGSITLDGTNANATGDYEIVFNSTSSFSVYNNTTGVLTASGTVGTEFSLNDMGITIESDGTFAEDYKLNISTTNGSNTLTSAEEGNRGLSAATTLTAGTWGSDTMLNSAFYLKFTYDSGALKYAAFDEDGTRMGSWVESGQEFTAYSSSKLDGSSFTFTSADAGIGDIWKVEFGSYDALGSAGGTVSIANASASFTFSYTGDDQLSDIVDYINENGAGIATASLDTSTGSSILKIEADNYGEKYRLNMRDVTGNLVSALGLTEDADTGTDASLKYNGKSYESSSGYFYGIEDNLVFEVANDASVASGYVNVTDKSLTQYMNPNGGDNGVSIFIRDLTAEGLGLKRADGTYALDVTDNAGSAAAIAKIDSVIDTVSEEAAKVGSLINAVDYHVDFTTDIYTEYERNLSLHEDTDFAEETANYYAAVAGRDAAAAMVAQANLMPSRVLALLGVTG